MLSGKEQIAVSSMIRGIKDNLGESRFRWRADGGIDLIWRPRDGGKAIIFSRADLERGIFEQRDSWTSVHETEQA